MDSAGSVGYFTSLALDASGYPHISYYGAWPNRDLKYAAWNGSSWDMQTVDRAGDVGVDSSLALDASSGYPRISYRDSSNSDLKYAAWNGTSWNVQTVDSAGRAGSYSSLALDASGYPHISYYYSDWPSGALKYAAWNGSSWDIQIVESSSGAGSPDSLALDANGYGHISYYRQWPNEDLKYASTRAPAEASHELPIAGYYMISFPLIPPSPTPDALLSDDLGDGNYYMWRWEAGGYQTVPTSAPGSQTTTLDIQEGFWLLAQAATLDIDVGGRLPHGDQTLPLQTGWNMVAAPYEAALDSLLVDNAGHLRSLAWAASLGWVSATFYYSHYWTGSYSTLTIYQTPPDALSLWYGYWVLAGVDCSLIVPPPTGGAGGTAIRAPQPAQPQPAWAFDVIATSAGSADSVTIAGADAATDEFDGFPLDRPKPPGAPGEGRVRMVLRGKGRRGRASPPYNDRDDKRRRGTEPPPYNKAPGRLMPWGSELAMETKGTVQDVAEWEFTVSGGVEGDTVTLRWPELSQLPKDRVAVLTDQDTGVRSFMRSRAQYEFAAPGDGGARSFAVTVKPAQEGTLLISGLTAMPTRGGAWDIGFQLSADAAVTARVYNVAGRRVADVAQGSELTRGRASLPWNGRSAGDTRVPGGMYLLRVTARTEDGQQASAVTVLWITR